MNREEPIKWHILRRFIVRGVNIRREMNPNVKAMDTNTNSRRTELTYTAKPEFARLGKAKEDVLFEEGLIKGDLKFQDEIIKPQFELIKRTEY